MKVGIRLRIDVTKIDKSAIYEGKKGKYLDVVSFVNLAEKGEFGDNGMVTQELGKERSDQGEKGAILGNATVFWSEGLGQEPERQANAKPSNDFDDDPPF